MNLNAQINNVAGQPLTARIGTVVSASPLQIDLQGTIIEAPNLGLVGAIPSVGANVLLLGQAVRGAKTSGSSWVCVGTIVTAP